MSEVWEFEVLEAENLTFPSVGERLQLQDVFLLSEMW